MDPKHLQKKMQHEIDKEFDKMVYKFKYDDETLKKKINSDKNIKESIGLNEMEKKMIADLELRKNDINIDFRKFLEKHMILIQYKSYM